MFQNTKKTTLSKPNVSETIVITVICAEMFSGPMENNTFQAQSVRNQCNHNYVDFPGYLLHPPANFFCRTQTKKNWTMSYLFFIRSGRVEKFGRRLEDVARKVKIHMISLVSDTLGLEGIVFHGFWLHFCTAHGYYIGFGHVGFGQLCLCFLEFW